VPPPRAFISESPLQTIEKHERKYYSSSSEAKYQIDATRATAAIQKLQQQLEEEKLKLELTDKTLRDLGDSTTVTITKLNASWKKEHEELEETQNTLRDVRDFLKKSQGKADISTKNLDSVVEQIAKLQAGGLDEAPTSLKVMMWDDSQTHHTPRETLLVNDGWFAYNGKDLGDENDSSTAPWFVETDDPLEADLIVWISVMACHECEIPPTHPIMHAHKVIVLDYSDGIAIHMTRPSLMKSQTELAYFKRSFVRKLPDSSFHSTQSDETIIPYAYSGSKHLMIPLDVPEANLIFQPKLPTERNADIPAVSADKYILHRPGGKAGVVYGAIPKIPDTKEYNNDGNGYFQDQRYENFLVPFRDRKWLVTTLIRLRSDGNSEARNNVVQWTHEHSKEKAGDPQTESEARAAGDRGEGDVDGGGNSYTAYVGVVDGNCVGKGSGYCFGHNYLRHLRDAKIIVTCNPSTWEGDFRTWEAFLSGAMVMVDTMYILPRMPNPPIDGTHFVMYDPTKKEDFMAKLKYYSDPANADEVRAIAHAGYEFVLRHHMAVNRVDYVLETVRSKLDKFVEDPAKRALFRLPSKQ